MSPARTLARRATERGFTLVEMSVAITVALFLLAGLLTMVQSTKRAFLSQNSLGQLQDSERLAMTMIGDVIQASGYFPNPLATTPQLAFVSNGTYPSPGQSVAGQANVSPQGDTISLRFITQSKDGIINCSGQSNQDPIPGNMHTYENLFSIDANKELQCLLTTDGVPAANGPVTLVTGVTNMTILYGVKTDFTVDDERVDSYLTATQMGGNDWLNVVCVRVQLTFTNPLYTGPGTGQQPTVTFARVVSVMNKAGVTT